MLKFKAVTEEKEVVLEVELFIPPENELTEIIHEKDGYHFYRYKGKDLPSRFWPGQSLLTRFDLTWDGKPIQIPDRFWSDLAGLRIETSTLDPAKLKPEFQWRAQEFLENLEQPHLSLSADGGTVLIEWERPEECDGRSTIRWIISCSGNVLRHRHQPQHEC